METTDQKIKRIKESLNRIPLDLIISKNKEQSMLDEQDFQDLKIALTQNRCSFCGNLLSHFSVHKPCFHWFLWRAKGLKKKHFNILFNQNCIILAF